MNKFLKNKKEVKKFEDDYYDGKYNSEPLFNLINQFEDQLGLFHSYMEILSSPYFHFFKIEIIEKYLWKADFEDIHVFEIDDCIFLGLDRLEILHFENGKLTEKQKSAYFKYCQTMISYLYECSESYFQKGNNYERILKFRKDFLSNSLVKNEIIKKNITNF